jgi:hypothetical protein
LILKLEFRKLRIKPGTDRTRSKGKYSEVPAMWSKSAFVPLLALTITAPANAQTTGGPAPIEKVVVYIECTSEKDGSKTQGTGVLVSENGQVLTAKHVVPPGFKCLGGIGTAATTPTRRLIRDIRQVAADAILLKFVRDPGEEFNFVRYRRITDNLKGHSITAHGFPKASQTGQVFQTEGVIATTIPDDRGMIGTSALQSSGMSGGPVFLKQDGSLIGIIAGADFDTATGSPASFGVLAAQEIANSLELTTSGQQTGLEKLAEKRFGPTLLNPGETKNFAIKLEREGLVDVLIESIKLADGSHKQTPGLAVRVCNAQTPVGVPCDHNQVGEAGVASKKLPAGWANISVFNFDVNPKLSFTMRVDYPGDPKSASTDSQPESIKTGDCSPVATNVNGNVVITMKC